MRDSHKVMTTMLVVFLPSTCVRKFLQFLPPKINMDNLMLESMFKVCFLTHKDVYMFHTF